jgi:uncharacterized protein
MRPGLVRVFLDANVLFTAAHNPNGKAAFVISLGSSGLLQLATSAYAQEEARRNLERKYPERIDAFHHQLRTIRLVADQPTVPCPADVLLTGDHRDFGFLMNAPELAGGLLIQTVAEFLAALGRSGAQSKVMTP